jgi:hypothetical protein
LRTRIHAIRRIGYVTPNCSTGFRQRRSAFPGSQGVIVPGSRSGSAAIDPFMAARDLRWQTAAESARA